MWRRFHQNRQEYPEACKLPEALEVREREEREREEEGGGGG